MAANSAVILIRRPQLCTQAFAEWAPPIDPKRIFITHAGCAAETVEAVRFEVEKLGLFEEILITEAGCTISNHCGPNTLGGVI